MSFPRKTWQNFTPKLALSVKMPSQGVKLSGLWAPPKFYALVRQLRYVAEKTFAAPLSTGKILDMALVRCREGEGSRGFQHVNR